MNILGFDTSTKAASVALLKDDVLVGEIVINDKRTHSQKLMPMLESLFKLANVTADDIDLLAVCIGPGSFTGLRIAMASVKAMAHAKDLKVVAVDSLESLAFNMLGVDKKIIAILDAQGSKVYTASYKTQENELKKLEEIEVLDIDELLERIDRDGEEVILLGEAVHKYRDKISNQALIEIASADKNISKASSVSTIASEKYRKNVDIHTHYDILPMYIRKSQAETQYEEKQKKIKEASSK